MASQYESVKCYVGMGSNLGASADTLDSALDEISAINTVECVTVSSYYQSKPHGPQDQPDYINAVACITVSLEPHILLDALQAIENQHGRIRTGEQWTARTLDLDILLFGNQQISTDRLTVPHPWMTQREFVLYPMHEIAPDLVLPDGVALSDCLKHVSSQNLSVLGLE